MNDRLRIVCCSPISAPGWRWISGRLDCGRCDWQFFNTAPRNAFERLVRKPNTARFRACNEAARAVANTRADLLITHSPLVTCWSQLFRRGEQKRCAHLAFSFNFTELPRGVRHSLMRRAFATIDRFVVFSNFERKLYGERFQIPLEKIDMIHWGVQPPPDDPRPPIASSEEYICAVGSQGRDYKLLFDAMRQTPEIRLEVVAAPENLAGIAVPANVSVRTNIPREDAWNILRHSRFMVLPLLHSEVPCGHVTLVSAMFLGKAVLATESAGISDYVQCGRNGLFSPPGDAHALAANIRRLWNDSAETTHLGDEGHRIAIQSCTEQTTIDYIARLLERLAETRNI